jgi:hypothetical protein
MQKSGERERGGKNMVEKTDAFSSLVDVVDRILDKGIAIDKILASTMKNPR